MQRDAADVKRVEALEGSQGEHGTKSVGGRAKGRYLIGQLRTRFCWCRAQALGIWCVKLLCVVRPLPGQVVQDLRLHPHETFDILVHPTNLWVVGITVRQN
jgi:hypothetical protein